MEDGSVISLRKSYEAIPKFVIKNTDGSKEEISVQDITDDDYFSYNNGKIVYASFKPDARWGNREFGEIRLLDVNTKQERKITSRSRYFSPDISHDGKMIVAVEQLIDGSSRLVLLDVNGSIIRSFKNNVAHVFSYPKFS